MIINRIVRKSVRGEKVGVIPLRHERIIQRMQALIPVIKPTRLYEWFSDKNSLSFGLGAVRYEKNIGNVVLVDSRVANFDRELEEYKRFKFVNEKDSEWNVQKRDLPITPKDFLEQIVSHEYAHIYSDKVYKLVVVPDSAKRRAVDEAFAFWFSERVTDSTSLFLSFRNQLDYDFDFAEKAYTSLHQKHSLDGFAEIDPRVSQFLFK